jgi:DeoR/GlpR family transcriptional regulator of sugar metabolism
MHTPPSGSSLFPPRDPSDNAARERATNGVSLQSPPHPLPQSEPPPWLAATEGKQKDEKLAIAKHVATHSGSHGVFVPINGTIQVGPGSTPLASVVESIKQAARNLSQPMMNVHTTNIELQARLASSSFEVRERLGGVRVTLTGGYINQYMHAFTGEIAAWGVQTPLVQPDTIIYGAHGISPDGAIRHFYHWEDEVCVQKAFATRSTKYRLLCLDNSKVGRRSGSELQLSIAAMLENAEECFIISTWPSERQEQVRVSAAISGFTPLLKEAALNPKLSSKNFTIRLINPDSSVHSELSLNKFRSSNQRNRKPSNRKISHVHNHRI